MKYVLECQWNTGHKHMGYSRALPKKCGMFFETSLCVVFKEYSRILPEGNMRRQDIAYSDQHSTKCSGGPDSNFVFAVVRTIAWYI
jgi:hypothetical protein